MKIDLNKTVTNLEGVTIKEPPDNKISYQKNILANLLVGEQKEIEPIKAYDWAVKLWNNGIIEIDEADFNKLRSFVENNKQIFVIAKAQILKELDRQKEKK